jgi:alpha-beta hydrolase superfamily lysophospholipase
VSNSLAEIDFVKPDAAADLDQTSTPDSGIQNLVYSCRIDHSGSTLKIIGWKVLGSKNPPLVLVHDVGEAISRYDALAKTLARAGYSVYGFSMRGHDSTLKLGSIPSFSILINDLLQVLAWVKHKEEGRKPIIIARGMGALLALSLSRAHTKFFQALILVSPMFNLNYNLTPFRRFLIRTIAEVAPSLRLPRWLSPTFTNASQETYVFQEKKRHPKLNSHFTFELLNSVAQAKKLLKRLKLPSLIVCPLDDPALRYEFLKPLLQKHKYSGRFTLKFVEGEDNLPLVDGGDTLKYLSLTITKWLQEYAERLALKEFAGDSSPDANAATVVSESTAVATQ